MIHTIKFKNYKSFKEEQTLKIKPITVIIGKNSAGKSALTKLPTLLSNSMQGNFEEPLKLTNGGVELGAEFRDLVYGRTRLGKLEFTLEDDNEKLEVVIGSGARSNDNPEIFLWKLESGANIKCFEIGDEVRYNGFQLKTEDNIPVIKSLSINTDYIGPFRILPERQYSDVKHYNSKHIGIIGENTYSILIKDALKSDPKLLEAVNEWYQKNFDGWGVQVNFEKDPFFQLELTRKNIELNINFRDVGQGMSQLLPIVTRAFMPVENETLIVIEQPELHLHPAAHGDIAELLSKSVAESSGTKKYLVETHSQNFVLRLRSLIAGNKINCEDVSLNYVKFDPKTNSSNLVKINIDKNGDVDDWPTGIFNEALIETLAIRTAQLDSL